MPDEVIQRRKTELEGLLTQVGEGLQQKVATLERSVVFGTAGEEIGSAANDPEVGLGAAARGDWARSRGSSSAVSPSTSFTTPSVPCSS